MPEVKEENTVAKVGHRDGYPFIDRGQLALMKAKPKLLSNQDKYIDTVADQMIKNAGK